MPLIALGLVCSLQLFAQNGISQSPKLELGLQVGVTEFLGDLGGGAGEGRPFILDTDWKFSRPLIGLYAKKHFNSWFAASANLNFTMLKGSDSETTNPGRSARDLEFKSNVFELYGLMHIQPLNFGKFGLHANLGVVLLPIIPKPTQRILTKILVILKFKLCFLWEWGCPICSIKI